MQDLKIAIPSCGRSKDKGTAEYLCDMGVDPSSIYIFVQNTEDDEAYHRDKADIGVNVVFREADFVTKARNNILDYFYSGDTFPDILMLDDDIQRIDKLSGKGLSAIENAEQFYDEMGRCFDFARKQGVWLWGVYPTDNAYFMSKTISTIVTVNTLIAFVGRKEWKSLRFDNHFKMKEDIELCSRLLSTGNKVFRYDYLAIKAKHRTNKGGCYDAWKTNENAKSVHWLLKRYPHLLAKNCKRNGEVRVKVRDEKIKIGK